MIVGTLRDVRGPHVHSPNMEFALNNNTLCIGIQHSWIDLNPNSILDFEPLHNSSCFKNGYRARLL